MYKRQDSVQYGEWKSSEYSLWAAPPFPVQVGAPPVHRRCVQPINSFSRYMTATNAHFHQQTLSINRAESEKKLSVENARHSRCSLQSYRTRLVHARGPSAENFVLALYDANTCPQPSEDPVHYDECGSSEYSLCEAPPFPVQVGAPTVHRRCVQPINAFSRYMTATNAHFYQQTLSINRAGSEEKSLC